jgi:hypothetical protein
MVDMFVYLDVSIEMLIIQWNDKVVFIPYGTTKVLQPAYLLPPGSPFAQMVVHLCTGHFHIAKLQKLHGNLVQMHFLESLVSFQTCPTRSEKPCKMNPDMTFFPCQSTRSTSPIGLSHIGLSPTHNLLNLRSTSPHNIRYVGHPYPLKWKHPIPWHEYK